MRSMRVVIPSLLVLLLLAAVFGHSYAQESGIVLDSWEIEVWPEYDKPAVLVIYSGTLGDEVALPQTLRIPVPAGVTINAVADVGANGNLMSVQWRSEVTEQGQDVVFDLETAQFVVEFYADVLSDPPSRSFALDLGAPYAAGQGSLALRQPSRATDMEISPALAQVGTDSLGNPLYRQELGPLEAGQAIPLSVTYTKRDADPSIGAAAETAAPVDQTTTEAGSAEGTPGWLVWLVAASLLVLVGALLVYLAMQWQQRRSIRSRQARRRGARARGTHAVHGAPPGSSESGWQNAYCPQCGRKYDATDEFCRSCGTQRR